MNDKEELTQIVETVQKDMGQFELLYSHIINKVYYWCYNIVNDKTLAEDLAQESMIRIYEKLNMLDNAEAFHSWMYVVVRNICYTHMRLNKHGNVQFLRSDEFDEEFENTIKEERATNIPDEAYNLKEIKQLIISFIENLPLKQKEVIMLFYIEEFNTAEIADMLNYNISTVKTRLYYGRKNLEKQLNAYQTKNDTQLYSDITLPLLLGEALKEHSLMIGSEVKLPYNAKLYKANKLSKASNILNKYGSPFINYVVTFSISVTLLSTIPSVTNNMELAMSSNLKSHLSLATKTEGNPYIKSITYSTFPTRDNTIIVFNLKKDVSKEKIKIWNDSEKVAFTKDEKKITVLATSNGKYSISIYDYESSFDVKMIDEYAPEIVGVINEGEYLQLIVHDELSQINYDKSYVKFKEKKYYITKDNKVVGRFKGDMTIYLFNDLNQYGYYEYNLE
ncbi:MULTISPECIES: sigma-70 family RNA polymerase sigma factor [unclassified Breznakia]|uniref:RNA polymerase sigma factor n=1 Tax=unclassified Breznakia TaxID=2623764 RepID=UPI00240539B7|nr:MULTISPECIES: sigma-70 family RNA polymerase sigma factor [unclassified Breznakia]MDF9837050.1 RNA polymerase sigma factor (sigma-70 family) [Breznakia sp. PFB2-8]MDF9858975.1 RNA polymerase sigma factor (sigma-70 family) [Breznakia sp. PH5-24]